MLGWLCGQNENYKTTVICSDEQVWKQTLK